MTLLRMMKQRQILSSPPFSKWGTNPLFKVRVYVECNNQWALHPMNYRYTFFLSKCASILSSSANPRIGSPFSAAARNCTPTSCWTSRIVASSSNSRLMLLLRFAANCFSRTCFSSGIRNVTTDISSLLQQIGWRPSLRSKDTNIFVSITNLVMLPCYHR